MKTKIVDFHSHILPGIDDGSPDTGTSVKMLGMAMEQGVEIQLLTPHYYPWRETVESFSQRRLESMRKLLNVWTAEQPVLIPGAEVAFFQNISRADKNTLHALCVRGTHSLLLEMPFQSWTGDMMDEIAALTLDRGIYVVLAHIERYMRYKHNRDYLERLLELPVTPQINAETFLRRFTAGKAMNFVKAGHKILLGSDAHNLTDRKPNLAEARRRIEKKLGADILHAMDESAAEILDMMPYETAQISTEQKG